MRDFSLNLFELIINSVRAKASCIHIQAKIKGGYIIFIVSDNGCGISETDVERVFDEHFTTKNNIESGMGLTIVKNISEQCNGHTFVSSKPGEGTRVFNSYRIDNNSDYKLGNLAKTLFLAIVTNPEVRFCIDYTDAEKHFAFDTNNICANGEYLPRQQKEIETMLTQNIKEVNGETVL